MVKAAWGTKRTCQSCGARFYDLTKAPIVCPKCGHAHSAEDFVKVRRGRGGAAAIPAAKAAAAAKGKPAIEGVPLADDELPAVEDGEEAIEDTDDLAEDEAEIDVDVEKDEPDR